ncbi:MAG: heme-binding protein [Bacteroidales bacterium]|nr:heme-binding protein [Bacteroidales bacterium]
MKTFLIVSAIAVFIFIIFQSFMLMPSTKTEEQKYTVILQEKDFEIRFYPSATIATIKSNAKTYKELANPGFRKLAGYIFGGNESSTSISMTAPVHMDINDSVSSMSFVMPSSYTEENLPKPNDPNVLIQKTADEYVAVIKFGGFASDRKLKSYSEKLYTILESKGITSYGHTRYLGYNPPFQLFNRRNEIIVSVNWKTESGN